ncbi:MAG: hypothetical protein KatS3mg038_2313 [Candidatus Kapaibacterium sp.]|nr:MAG: hypothetical protein KatS3mg038_2313 [Candidatus Kapabacteria bacterium]
MLACFDVHGDHLCYGSCGLPAGNRAFFFRGGLSVWLLDVPDDHVQPAGPRDVVAIVSRSPAVEPYATVASWVLRTRADRQFRRHGRWRATVRCVRIERLYLHPTPASHVAWVARRYRVPVLRASALRTNRRRRQLGRDRAGTIHRARPRPRHPGDRRWRAAAELPPQRGGDQPSSSAISCGRGHSLSRFGSRYRNRQ